MRLWWRLRRGAAAPAGPQDEEVARLAAKADAIAEELELVVKQMGNILRGTRGTDRGKP